MQIAHVDLTTTIMPSEKDVALAEKSSRALASYLQSSPNPTVQFSKNGKQELAIPSSALRLLVNILVQMAAGNAVTIIPIQAELTTQEAADLINVSRPFLVKLLEGGAIPYRKVGKRRRVLAKDILQYKHDIDQARLKTLEKLTAQAQELDMGY